MRPTELRASSSTNNPQRARSQLLSRADGVLSLCDPLRAVRLGVMAGRVSPLMNLRDGLVAEAGRQ